MVSYLRLHMLSFGISLVALSLVFTGCGDEEASEASAFPYDGAVMGYSVQDRPIIVERFGSKGPVVFLFHTIHGDEVPAEQLGEEMRTWLLLNPNAWEGLQVLFVTQVNPDGYVMDTRYNASGVDLNRNFPATNFEATPTFGPSPASEPETQVIVSLVEDSEPTAIVSVHSPLDAINYDGPAEALAVLAAEESGMAIDQDIGFYPGSFGSYAGIDLQIPTVTLELPTVVRDLDGHLPGLIVERVALEYVWDTGDTGPALSDIVVDLDPDDEYETWILGKSKGERYIVAEQFGTHGPPVLVVAGLDGNAHGVLVAERFRAQILGKLGQATPQRQVLLVTVANPDGLASGSPLNGDGLDPDRSFSQGFEVGDGAGNEPFECLESRLFRDLIQKHDVGSVVVILGRTGRLALGIDGAAGHMAEAVSEITYATPQPFDSGRPGSLAAWAASQEIPALTLSFPMGLRRWAVLRANNVSTAVLAAVQVADL
jgi:protein MpaA